MSTIVVPLTQGKFTTIDEVDLPAIGAFTWHAVRRGNTWYAVTTLNRELKIYMHDLLVCPEDGHVADHRDGDGLNNRRCNLREATRAQNNANRMLQSGSTSGFKGVSWSKCAKKWHAYIDAGGKRKYLGLFTTKDDAAWAYDDAARFYYGEFAALNFPIRGERSCLGVS